MVLNANITNDCLLLYSFSINIVTKELKATNPDKVNEYKKFVSCTARRKLVGSIFFSIYLNLPSSVMRDLRITVCVSKCFYEILLLNLEGIKTGNKSGFYSKHEARYKILSKFDLKYLTPSEKE
jgi:hypothetical protein